MFGTMAKILISLIGDQTAPNIFMIRDERFRSIDRHVFVTTERMEAIGRSDHLLTATGIPESNYLKVLVSADDFEEIQQKMAGLNLSREDEYFLNLTSGTKIMSLGMFHFFSRNAYRVRVFYLPFGKNAYRQFFPVREQREFELSYNIGLTEYLTIYGIRQEPKPELWTGPPALTDQLIGAFTSDPPKGTPAPWDWANDLRKLYNQGKGKRDIDPSGHEGMEDWLSGLGFPQEGEEQRLSPPQMRYFIGGWLEQWSARMIREQLALPDSALGLGVKIRPRRLDQEGFGRNEFDVMFIYRNTLHILECKTSLGSTYRSSELPPFFDQALYRLAALRREFGMNVRTALLTPDKRLRQSKSKLKPVAAARAQLLHVAIIDRYELLRGPEHWVNKLVDNNPIW